METFMLNTGFYDVVTRTEGRRYIDRQAEREALREEVFKHLADRGIDIEPIIKEQDHKGR